MSQSAFTRKFDSYITFLETKLNGSCKRWYGMAWQLKSVLPRKHFVL